MNQERRMKNLELRRARGKPFALVHFITRRKAHFRILNSQFCVLHSSGAEIQNSEFRNQNEEARPPPSSFFLLVSGF
jgi:hypothetical protein